MRLTATRLILPRRISPSSTHAKGGEQKRFAGTYVAPQASLSVFEPRDLTPDRSSTRNGTRPTGLTRRLSVKRATSARLLHGMEPTTTVSSPSAVIRTTHPRCPLPTSSVMERLATATGPTPGLGSWPTTPTSHQETTSESSVLGTTTKCSRRTGLNEVPAGSASVFLFPLGTPDYLIAGIYSRLPRSPS